MRPFLSSSSSSGPFTILPTLALLLLSTSSITPTQAAITCESPSSGTSIQPGSSISFRWGDDGSLPKSGDVYSADATVSCSSGGQIAQVSSISNGQSWTVPQRVLDSCGGGELQVKLSGTRYDFLHLFHGYTWEAGCGSVEVERPAPVATTTTAPAPAVTTTTTTSQAPTSVATTDPATAPTASTPTLPVSTTPALNGTLPPGVLPPGVLPAPPTATGTNPDVTSVEHSSPNDPSVNSSSSSSSGSDSGSKSGGTSKAAIGAIGAVGVLAAVAVVVFGFVLVKRRQRRQAREQRWMDYNYSNTPMSEKKGGDGNEYAFSGGVGPGAGEAPGLKDQRDSYTPYHSSTSPEATSSPSHRIQSTEYVIPHPAPPADQDSSDCAKNQNEKSMLPTRPARSYQGEFDDPAPWDGQLGYFPQPPQQQGGGGNENIDLGYEYIQGYVASDPSANQHSQQHDNQSTSLDLNNNTDANSNKQFSMRASSQLPADLEYFAQLREASWPMPPLTSPPASPTSPTSSTLSRPGTGTGAGSSPAQMLF